MHFNCANAEIGKSWMAEWAERSLFRRFKFSKTIVYIEIA